MWQTCQFRPQWCCYLRCTNYKLGKTLWWFLVKYMLLEVYQTSCSGLDPGGKSQKVSVRWLKTGLRPTVMGFWDQLFYGVLRCRSRYKGLKFDVFNVEFCFPLTIWVSPARNFLKILGARHRGTTLKWISVQCLERLRTWDRFSVTRMLFRRCALLF